MPHDDHFLSRLERASDEEVNFALSLYYKANFTRDIINLFELSDAEERLAVGLSDRKVPSHAILTRDGSFVTCLAPGMKFDNIPVMTYRRFTQLDREHGHFKKKAGELETQIADKSFFTGKKADSNYGRNMTREEFKKWTLLLPLLVDQVMDRLELLAELGDNFDRNLQAVARKGRVRSKRERTWLRKYWELRWDMGNFTTIFCSDLPLLNRVSCESSGLFEMGRKCLSEKSLAVSLMGLWAVARVGKTLFPLAKKMFIKPGSLLEYVDAFLMLFAIALRHSRYKSEVIKLFKRKMDMPPDVAEICATMSKEFSRCLDDQETYEAAAAVCAVKNFEKEYRKRTGVTVTDEIPVDLQILFFARDEKYFLDDCYLVHEATWFIAWAIKRKPEEFFVPEKYKELFYPYRVEQAREMLMGGRIVTSSGVVKDNKKPGRNDPCHCGSGKKYKKCCLKKVSKSSRTNLS